MAAIVSYQRGETVPIWRNVKNSSGTLVTPDQGCDVTLKDPDGTLAVAIDTTDIDDVAMSAVSTGLYVYYFRTLTTDKKGEWNWSAKATHGSGDAAKYDIRTGAFNLT